MTVSDLQYPVVCFWRHLFRIEKTSETLTTTTKAGIKNRMFDNVLVVGSNGHAIRVKSARKMHGVGPFRGYNIFLNQRIRVALEIDGEPFELTVDEVRKRILDSFKQWHGWQTRDDFDDLKASIENAAPFSTRRKKVGCIKVISLAVKRSDFITA